MAYPPSSYGARPPVQGFRRSFTAPHRQLSVTERAGLDNSDADAGILYTHPHVRIFSFAPPPESIKSKSGETHAEADYPIDTVETLPWRSRTENLITSGPLVIEKVRGSVPCFKRGDDFVQPCVRNSQCWCVDGESKFVLRKGKLQYYRFELPTTTEQDRTKVEDFKAVLAKVLKYERTPCPFKRAFHVELPEDAIIPRRKGKWKPREGSLPSTPDTESRSLRRSKLGRSLSMQVGSSAQEADSPSARRGSDYGFVQTPRHTSLRTSYLADRPETPSSMASSDELESRDVEERDLDYDSPAEVLDDVEESSEREVEQDISVLERGEIVQDPVVHAHAQEIAETTEGQVDPTQPDEVIHLPDLMEHKPQAESLTCDANIVSPREEHEESAKLENEHQVELGENDTTDFPQEEHEEPAELADERRVELTGNDTTDPLQESSTGNEIIHVPVEELLALPEGTFLPTTPELHFLEEHADLLEEHGFSDEELEPLAAAAADLTTSPIYQKMAESEKSLSQEIPDDTRSIASTTESFHTIDSGEPETSHSTAHDVDATPIAESHDSFGLRNRQHRRDVSEITVTASTFSGSPEMENVERFVTSQGDQRPPTPRLIRSSASDDSWPDPRTPSDIQRGLRQRLKSRRSLSPLPPSRNVFTGGSQNQGNHLTSAILQKACNVALVKPIEVVVLLVHVLARIAGGATVNDLMSGELFKRPHQRRHSTSFPDQVSRPPQDDDEDDFGIPVRGRAKSREDITKRNGEDTDAESLFDLD